MFWESIGQHLVSTLLFSVLGLAFFLAAFWGMCKVAPFSIRKEIEEDQNVALGVIIAAVILGLAMVVAAAVHG